jgi:hypothetical protein
MIRQAEQVRRFFLKRQFEQTAKRLTGERACSPGRLSLQANGKKDIDCTLTCFTEMNLKRVVPVLFIQHFSQTIS